ncbi:MAG: hypothetical protein U9R57_06450 [Thermodesulfobacteriota bacterium]|nr:hypothetical protein [Thermodesulfobacteriota bacterium]
MPKNTEDSDKKKKDRWDKADILLRGSMTGVVALIGILISGHLNTSQDRAARLQLYTELMSNREQSESALRKDMFQSIIGAFLGAGKTLALREQVVNLELLVYNFHESLNLKPLFKSVERKLIQQKIKLQHDASLLSDNQNLENITETDINNCLIRLRKAATDIARKQLLVLKGKENIVELAAPLGKIPDVNQIRKDPYTHAPIPLTNGIEESKIKRNIFTLRVGEAEVKRLCEIKIVQQDPKNKELQVSLRIRTPPEKGRSDEVIPDLEVTFWVGFFDFPMIDNTRLSDDQRCALVLNKFPEPEDLASPDVELTLVCFPGEHSSLKDKPYYEEMLKRLAFGSNAVK